jgi:hypothetical protein
MRSFFRTQILIAACFALAGSGVAAQNVGSPRLVVMMVIDQLRGDLLDHYAPAFDGGLRRLLDEGFVYAQASHAHGRTSTAPGHATLATGVFPSRHAVVSNGWAQRVGLEWQVWYAVRDVDSPILGFENEPALEGRSPRTMIRDALPDWLHAYSQDARIVSISKKDRAAIPLGGLTTEHVYWMVPELGRFVTSRHYMTRYPGWLDRFNERVMPAISQVPVWESEVPEGLRSLARPDSAWYEGDGIHTTFPHVSSEENPPDSPQIHNLWAYDQRSGSPSSRRGRSFPPGRRPRRHREMKIPAP